MLLLPSPCLHAHLLEGQSVYVSCLTCQSHPQAYRGGIHLSGLFSHLLSSFFFFSVDMGDDIMLWSLSILRIYFCILKLVNSMPQKQTKREMMPCLCGSQRGICRLSRVQVVSLTANVSPDNAWETNHTNSFHRHVVQTVFCPWYLVIKGREVTGLKVLH